jgi:hypothetical protein
MKRIVLSFLVFFSLCLNASANDSLKIIILQREISNLKVLVSRLQQENESVRSLFQKQKENVDSLQNKQEKQYEKLITLADKIGTDLSETNNKLQTNADNLSDSINHRTWLGLFGVLLALALLGAVYYMLKRRISNGSSAIDKIKVAQEGLETAQKALQEESVKLDNKLVELLDKQINAVPKQEASTKPDHSFALKVGDEIAKIETNLSKMDPEVKGYKQLKQALKRIKDNFNAHGYEIVELLGLDYNDGMPFEAQFVPDENLPEGKRIISGITRLQINYNGEMIQSAKIVVRQNI